ncbi:hypothetical protein DMENIID0001_155470 [Sergentomyia squamirostris]
MIRFFVTILFLCVSSIECNLENFAKVSVDNKVFYVSREKVTFLAALRNCQEHGLVPATVDSYTENKALLSSGCLAAASGQTTTGTYLWLGYLKIQNVVHNLNTLLVPTYTNFEPGQPDKWEEFCVEMECSDGEWHDNYCDRKYNYVCQEPGKGTELPSESTG